MSKFGSGRFFDYLLQNILHSGSYMLLLYLYNKNVVFIITNIDFSIYTLYTNIYLAEKSITYVYKQVCRLHAHHVKIIPFMYQFTVIVFFCIELNYQNILLTYLN